MTRGGIEEEKMATSPMFPRLHVNDTDKGGPRAPPRNKMALYEQLSIPSSRLNHSSLPLPPHTARNIVAPTSGQGNGLEGTAFPPFCVSASAPLYSVEKVKSRASDGESMRTIKMEFKRRSMKHVNFKSANAVGSVAECSSFKRDSSGTKTSCRKRVDEEDDFRVPTFVNSDNSSHLNKDTTGMGKRRLTTLQGNSLQSGCPNTLNDFVQLASSSDRPLEQINSSNIKSGKQDRSNEQKLHDSVVIEDQREESLSHAEAGVKLAAPSKLAKISADAENAGNCGACQQSRGNGALDGPIARSESQSKGSHGSANMADICNRTSDDKENRSLDQRDADKIDEMSDTSMMDSISGFDISPDDVVGSIGPKQFWKARRAIVNQQRVFAVQVFELHRLIKVQKLLAASPHLLLEENSCNSPQKVPTTTSPLESYAKPQPLAVKQKDEPQKPNHNLDHQTENTGAAPLPVHDDVLNKARGQPSRSTSPCSGNTYPVPPPSDNRSKRWCFQPAPAQQWLVPVMSPSEGLVYKPYAGPCPPAAGFMAPVYSPMSLPAGYAVSPHHQQQNLGLLSSVPPVAPTYMPTSYGLPAMTPISSSAADQLTPMIGPRTNAQMEQNSRSSCTMSFPKSDAFTGRRSKAHASKDSELQGSTASSPCERAQLDGRDVLSLFPLASVAEASAQPSDSNDKEHQIRVIRVVPHNAKSATESAARIFRSIQEERYQVEQ